MVEHACKSCRILTSKNICPNCKKTGVSGDWAGELIVINPKKSVIAKKANITKSGRYALRVR